MRKYVNAPMAIAATPGPAPSPAASPMFVWLELETAADADGGEDGLEVFESDPALAASVFLEPALEVLTLELVEPSPGHVVLPMTVTVVG
jgi:hypothetical protein